MKILFMTGDLQTNGATTALLPLMRLLVEAGHDVSLFLFWHNGPWLDKIDPRINLLPEIMPYRAVLMSRYAGVWYALKCGALGLAFRRALAAVCMRFGRGAVKLSILENAPKIPGEFDVAIGFTVGYPWRMIHKKVDAKYRIAWVDNDLKSIAAEWKYFMRPEKCDALVFESNGCRDEFRARYPALTERSFTVHNTVDEERVRRMAQEAMGQFPKTKFRISTVGRLTYQKGTDLIPAIAAQLKDIDFEWLLVGDGIDRPKLEEQCRNLGVADKVKFVGLLKNPFGVVASSDLYVQTSRFEGWGTTLAEALVLGRYAVVSDIPQFKEQITDESVGLIGRSEDVADIASVIRRAIARVSGGVDSSCVRKSICCPENVLAEISAVLSYVERTK